MKKTFIKKFEKEKISTLDLIKIKGGEETTGPRKRESDVRQGEQALSN